MTLLIAGHQLRLLSKSRGLLALFVAAPLLMIFVFGQAFTGIFNATGAGIAAADYFGVTLFTMAVFQGSFIAAWGIFKERKANADSRLYLAPLGRGARLYGTFLGSWAALLALGSLVLLAARFILSVNYGPSPAVALLLLAVESGLASALGVAVACLIGDERPAGAILNTVVPLLVFLGGGYTIIPDSGFLHDISVASPLRWINLALLAATRPEPNRYLLPAILICLPAAALLLALASLGQPRPALAGLKTRRAP